MRAQNILILDDNKFNYEAIKTIIEELGFHVKIFTTSKVSEAFCISMEHEIDIFVLDIDLSEEKSNQISGLQFAERIRENCRYEITPILIITAYTMYELDAYRSIQCFGYITKPIHREQVKELFIKLLRGNKQEKPKSKWIDIRIDGVLYPILQERMVYMESIQRALYIYLEDNVEIKVPNTGLKQMMEQVDAKTFLRCHKSIAVNRNYIDTIDLTNRYIKLVGRTENIEIGSRMKKTFLEELKNGL